MIRAIATDLDGTLFYPKRKIRLLKTENRKFLKDLYKQNVEIVLVTGRNRSIARKVERKIKSPTPISMVGCSGSFIVHKGEMIREKPMDKEKIKALLDEFDKHKDIKSVVFMGNFDGMLIDPTHLPTVAIPFALVGLRCQGAYYEKSRFGRKKILAMLDDPSSRVYKVMPILGLSDHQKKGMERAKKFAEYMRPIFHDQFEFFESGTAVEILAAGTNKAESLNELFREFGIGPDEVIVAGDSGNDIPMLEAFPNSFAMKTAPEYVRKTAKHEIGYVYELDQYLKTTE